MNEHAAAMGAVSDGDLTATLIGQRVQEIRVQRSWSTHDLATRIGVADHVVLGVESGERVPTVELLVRFAAALLVPPGDLYPFGEQHAGIPMLLPITGAPDGPMAQVIGGGPGNPTQTYLYDLPAGQGDGGFGTHRGQELIVVVHGEVVCSSLGGPDVVVRPGRSWVVDTAVPHAIRAGDAGPARFLVVCTDDCDG
ncbi:helix-turn-helix domain-containing protein [uncultured Amnibacterium sp.]|uniref:helix-turn-helix domain-containing protein n=1 Tax=uncultured Amnibacterium sp. TaxID=1631851 RepID=UPI0035CB5DD2